MAPALAMSYSTQQNEHFKILAEQLAASARIVSQQWSNAILCGCTVTAGILYAEICELGEMLFGLATDSEDVLPKRASWAIYHTVEQLAHDTMDVTMMSMAVDLRLRHTVIHCAGSSDSGHTWQVATLGRRAYDLGGAYVVDARMPYACSFLRHAAQVVLMMETDFARACDAHGHSAWTMSVEFAAPGEVVRITMWHPLTWQMVTFS